MSRDIFGGEEGTGTQCIETRDNTQHPITQRTGPTRKNDLVEDVDNAEVVKPSSRDTFDIVIL